MNEIIYGGGRNQGKSNSVGKEIKIYNIFEIEGQERINSMKLKNLGPFVQVYINNGKTKHGIEKLAQFRIYHKNLKALKEWLNTMELE